MHSRTPQDPNGRDSRDAPADGDDARSAAHERARALDDESADPVGRDPYAPRGGGHGDESPGDRAPDGFGPAQRHRHQEIPDDASGADQQGYASGQYGHASQFGFDTDDRFHGGTAAWGGREAGGHGAYGGSSGGERSGPPDANADVDVENESNRERTGYDGNDGGYMGDANAGGSRDGAPPRDPGSRDDAGADQQQQQDIKQRLAGDPSIDARDIDVQVHDGKVTLTGHVDSRETKIRVEELVDARHGVTDVDNRLGAEGRIATSRDVAPR